MKTPDEVRQTAADVLAGLERISAAIDDFYIDLHQHPELSLHETRTSALVADRFRKTGLETTGGVGGNGVVGVMRNGDGPVVLIRADMDALPIREETGVPYASQVSAAGRGGGTVPVMHACGHDLHTASQAGVVELLAARRDCWKGTLVAVAQPAEEIFQGAGPMLRDGLYRRFPKPDVVLGQHNWPYPVGTVAHRGGNFMAAGASLDVTIFGRGGHASRPEAAIDPVVIASSAVTRLQAIVAREIAPSEPAVVTVGKFQAGHQANIIPAQASLGINIRSYRDEVQKHLLDAIARILKAECEAGRCPREPEIAIANGAPALVNDEAVVERVRAAHAAWFGADRIVNLSPMMATEDFSLYGKPGQRYYDGEPVPIAYWLVGAMDPSRWDQAAGETPEEKLCHVPSVHSPEYLPARPAAQRAAIEAMVVAALAYLA